jgi:hypothetical protein
MIIVSFSTSRLERGSCFLVSFRYPKILPLVARALARERHGAGWSEFPAQSLEIEKYRINER